MKIYTSIVNKISYSNNNCNQNKKAAIDTGISSKNYQSFPLLSPNYFLSFKGGASSSLNQTMANFYEAEILEDRTIVPKKVRKAADFVIAGGNPNNLKLVDLHKHVYEDILYCETLDEVKSKYSEFKDVLSANEVDARSDSFISDVKNGKCEIFSPDEDLSLQLLKLYWGEAYSLNDLKNHVNGQRQLAPIMVKLNIPRVHRQYGQMLKLSDPEYNERFIETLKLKQMERFEKNNGHIYIPRGVVTPEQRVKICEALIEYYAKNPGRIYLQSMRLHEFYKNNPEAAKFLNEVIFDAWRLGSSKSVKSSMVKYFDSQRSKGGKNSKLTAPSDKELADVKNLGSQKRLIMQDFWDATPAARKQFGTSLKCSLSRIKKIQAAARDVFVIDNSLPAYPKKMADMMKDWVEKKGYDPDSLILTISISNGDVNKNVMNKSMGARLVTEYFDKNPLMSDIYADSLSYAISELKQYLTMQKTKSGDIAVRKIESAARGRSYMYTNELVSLYLDLVQFLIKSHNIDGITKLVSVFDRSYDDVIKMRKKSGYPVPN